MKISEITGYISSDYNEWVKRSDFNDVGPILLYYKNLKNGKNIHEEVKERKRTHAINKKIESERDVLVRRNSERKKVKFDSNTEEISFSEREIKNTEVLNEIQTPKGLEFNRPGAKMQRQSLGKRKNKYIPGSFKE